MNTESKQNAYEFEFKTLSGNQTLPLSKFKNKVILIVNTASNCGFTKQYEELQNLYLKFKDKGLEIIGVPSNDFGSQEPGNAEEINNFCKINYGVTFPLTAKEVVSGDSAHPFYKWAKQNFGVTKTPKWNFHKYIIDKHGNLVDYFSSITSPQSKKVESLLEKLCLEQK